MLGAERPMGFKMLGLEAAISSLAIPRMVFLRYFHSSCKRFHFGGSGRGIQWVGRKSNSSYPL